MFLLKKQIKVWLLFAAIILAFGFIFLKKKKEYWQDEVSHSVQAREYIGFIHWRDEIEFQTAGFDSRKVSWVKGVELAFRRPLNVGECVLVIDKQKNFLFKISSIEEKKILYSIKNDENEWIQYVCESEEMIKMGELAIKWSFNTNRSIYLYADDYLTKKGENLFGVMYPISNSKIDFNNIDEL